MQIPIVLFEGKILDGRNRYRAALMVGAHCPVNYYSGASPTAHVLSLNLKRRQLTPSQKASAGADAEPFFADEARKRLVTSTGGDEPRPVANLPQAEKGKARDAAAAATGASPRAIQDAKAIKKAAPDVFDEIKAGKITVNAAKAVVAARQDPAPAPAEPQPTSTKPAGKLPAYKPSNGLMYADNAISQLAKIHSADTERPKAFSRVQRWLEERMGPQDKKLSRLMQLYRKLSRADAEAFKTRIGPPAETSMEQWLGS